ncbi:adenylate kinase [Raphidocelis subcapitata]|uniref:adenylate kinase n=1 Tax=Raphidocelis subcapitata TaxID=307507 RepID=A0A2V0NND8_9CHLO|nr:adenylate kinase [Raphidocelis subcapitata]|eukprot:GBF89078.1 adenylate kinase [Raphidocelis subcapitata]
MQSSALQVLGGASALRQALPALQRLPCSLGSLQRCLLHHASTPATPGRPPLGCLSGPCGEKEQCSAAPSSPGRGETSELFERLFPFSQRAQEELQHAQEQASNSGGGAAWAPEAGFGAAARRSAAAADADGACAPLMPGASNISVGMEGAVVFEGCWRRFTNRHGSTMRVPREIVFLNGAPGSGKGVNTPHILATRGIDSSICVSSLLTQYPEARKFIDAGEMISDAVVGDALLEALLGGLLGGGGGGGGGGGEGAAGGEYAGVVVDGFPRTAVQVDFLKMLHDKLAALHRSQAEGPRAHAFPRPSFKVVVLYVDEETSVRRQLQRAAQTQARNRRALDAGAGGLQAARATDVSADKARKRYTVFRHHYSAILRLKQFFPFHLIDAMGSLSETQSQIEQELRYQSSLDLSEDAYALIADLPLARELQQQARQQLVSRLENYACRQRPLFARVLAALRSEVLPLLRRGGLAGRAEWTSREALFTDHPAAVDMLLDVLADRGFQASYARERVDVPVSFDAATGAVATEERPLHRFVVRFEAAGVRDGQALKALEISARIVEAARSALFAGPAGARLGALDDGAARPGPITASFIPSHLDHALRAQQQQQQQQAGKRPEPQRITRCAHSTPSCEHAEEVEVSELRAVAGR